MSAPLQSGMLLGHPRGLTKKVVDGLGEGGKEGTLENPSAWPLGEKKRMSSERQNPSAWPPGGKKRTSKTLWPGHQVRKREGI